MKLIKLFFLYILATSSLAQNIPVLVLVSSEAEFEVDTNLLDEYRAWYNFQEIQDKDLLIKRIKDTVDNRKTVPLVGEEFFITANDQVIRNGINLRQLDYSDSMHLQLHINNELVIDYPKIDVEIIKKYIDGKLIITYTKDVQSDCCLLFRQLNNDCTNPADCFTIPMNKRSCLDKNGSSYSQRFHRLNLIY